MPIKHSNRNPEAPHIPHLDGLIHRRSGNDTVIILVPITRENLEFMSREDHGGAGFTNVPYAEGAVAGGGCEYIGVAGVPDGGVNAVGMLLEGANRGGAVESPELDGVIPGSRDEGVTADGVVIGGVNLAGVFLEGADGVGGGGESEVVELDGAVGDGGDDEGFVGFRPGEVVDAVSGVVSDELGDGDGGVRGEVEDVETAVAEDSEVLGGGDGEAILVEWAELDGVTVERGFENGHCLIQLDCGLLQFLQISGKKIEEFWVLDSKSRVVTTDYIQSLYSVLQILFFSTFLICIFHTNQSCN